MKRLTIKHLATLTAVLLLSVLAISCGGGGGSSGGGDGGSSNLTAVFRGDAAGDVGMSAGSSSGEDFEIQVNAVAIDKLAGAAFHIFFDHTSAALVGWSGTGSIFGTGGDYRAALVAPGEIAVSAAMTGTGAGIDNATGLMITLSFRATASTSQNRFTFGIDAPPDPSRRVKICPTAGQACSDVVPASWTGGTLMVTQ
jgi:hypothetical protein